MIQGNRSTPGRERWAAYVLLLLLGIPLFYLSVSNVHPWGDDWTQYVKEAWNIAHGRPFYRSGYVFNKYNSYYAPPYYPVGFPLLLAPVVAGCGMAVKPMLMLISVISVGLLLIGYEFFRKFTGPVIAVCMSLLLVYSGFTIELKRCILADFPCLLFVLLYLVVRNSPTFSRRRIVVLIGCAAVATLMRTQAFVLVGAELLWLCIAVLQARLRKGDYRQVLLNAPSVYVAPGVVIVLLLCNKVLFPAPGSANDFYTHFLRMSAQGGLPGMLHHNASALASYIYLFFSYHSDSGFVNGVLFVVQRAALVSCIIGFFIAVRRQRQMHDVFFVLMCLLILLLPVQDSRYFLPAMPLVYYYCMVTMRALKGKLLRLAGWKLALPATALYLAMGLSYFKDNLSDPCPGGIPTPREFEGFGYIQQHVADSDMVVFAKPRLLTLYTGRQCMAIAWELDARQNRRILDSKHVRYMLVVDNLDDTYYKDYLSQVPPADSVKIAPTYTLYTLR